MSESAEQANTGSECDFASLGIQPDLTTALERLRLDAPTEIQCQMIPVVLAGKDCLARAHSGTGKTNTYLLPILQTVTPGEGVQALVIQPTRSIALQFQRNLQRFSPEKPLRTAVALGGRPSRDVPDPLSQSPDVIIAIPRGAASLLRSEEHDFSSLRLVVIDEVDAILDERGPENLNNVAEALQHEHQTIMLTGVFDDAVRELAGKMLSDPVEIDSSPGKSRAAQAGHSYFATDSEEKFDALLSFCKQEKPRLALVFTADEEEGREVAHRLERARVSCRWINERHGAPRGGSRGQRDERGGRGGRDQRGDRSRRPDRDQSEVIVACDPAPRKLSTIPASHILQYDLPGDVDTYMFRMDQVARLRKGGEVIAFVEPDQQDLVPEIEQRLETTLEKRQPLKRPERRGREKRSDSGDRPPRSKPAPTTTAKSDESQQGRLNDVLIRNDDLESRGVQPPPRTLGSRFRTNRRGRPLRRPGK